MPRNVPPKTVFVKAAPVAADDPAVKRASGVVPKAANAFTQLI